jgi:type IV pilus assembly protein PilC
MLTPSNTPSRRTRALRFRFSGIDAERNPVSGIVVAYSKDSARDVLLQRYAHLFSLEEVVVQDWRQLLAGHRDVSASLPVYTRALATMFDAGLPLTSTFEVVAQGDDPYLNEVMLDVAGSMREGRSLSQSLGRWNSVFDSAFVGMCRAAERSGRLHHTIKSLATLLEKRWRMNKRLKAAFSYPLLVSVVALAIFWILVAFVVPGLVPTFRSIGARLPWPTQVLVQLGELSTSLPVLLLGAAVAIFAAVLLFRAVVRGEYFPGLYLWADRARLRLPLVGPLVRLAILTRTLATMAALFESGLPLSHILESAGQVSGSPVYRKHFLNVMAEVRDGKSMAEAMESTQAFPPLLVGIAALGEESGKLPSLLLKAADLYEEDLDMRLGTLATLLEPVLLGIMGLVIGFIVLATFLPLINLLSSL